MSRDGVGYLRPEGRRDLAVVLAYLWEHGQCADAWDPDDWYRGMPKGVADAEWVARKRAAALCDGCPVIHECLWYALEAPELFGVWGGASEADRTRLRRDLRTSGSSQGWQPAPTSTGSTGGDAA